VGQNLIPKRVLNQKPQEKREVGRTINPEVANEHFNGAVGIILDDDDNHI
jgi:hypothetical protein